MASKHSENLKILYLAIIISTLINMYQYYVLNIWISRQIQMEETILQKLLTDEKTTSASPTPQLQQIPSSQPSKQKIKPPLYVITATYRRPEQIAELIRLSHTLMLVKDVHWIVVEDATMKTAQVTQLLNKTGLKYDYLTAPMPKEYRKKKYKPKGVSNRNRGLQWIRENARSGVFYFADDDNTYDLELFKEIRKTKKVAMFPVGLLTSLGMSSPIVKNGKLSGFYDGWLGSRKFPVDMAGFAVSVEFLLSRPNASMPYDSGYEEDGFLRSLKPLEPKEVELLASNCTKILVWHTQTKKEKPSKPLNLTKFNNTNLVELKRMIV